jgi:hypothetical protein
VVHGELVFGEEELTVLESIPLIVHLDGFCSNHPKIAGSFPSAWRLSSALVGNTETRINMLRSSRALLTQGLMSNAL